jgi:hypothetical protein
MPNYGAIADLHRYEMRPMRFGAKISPGPRYLRSLSMKDCVKQVMSKRPSDAHTYSIIVPLEAGFGKDILNYWDIEAISQRPDFPCT